MKKTISVGVVTLIIQVGLCLTINPGCPVPEDIYPCRCSKDSTLGVTMKCDHISSVAILKNALDNSKGYNFDLVLIRNSTLEYLPHSFFENVQVKEMRMQHLTLNQVFDREPKALKELTTLAVTSSTVKSGSFWKILQPLKSLQVLFIAKMPLITIGTNFSQYVTDELHALYFTETETKTIESGVFDKFECLRKLIITNGSISELRRDMFPSPFNVDSLSFDHQKIRSIPDGLFSDMPNLETLTLVDNQIATVPENAFNNFRLRLFLLDSNPIKCDCRFKWLLIKKPYLSGTCTSPKYLAGKRLTDLNRWSIHC